jgi:DNA-binding transcriptional ArsR family regulator
VSRPTAGISEPSHPGPSGYQATGHEAGTPENPLKITDPRTMRALAHPARIAILQRLAIEGPATATECAEVAGLSPSACSYHLRALAGHGFVEEDQASAADGRHRPWRARVITFSFGDEPGQPGTVRAAGRLPKESLLAHIEEIRAQYLDRLADYPSEWCAAAGMTQDVLHVTAEELATLRSEMQDLLGRYRRLDRAERPPGAQRVHAVLEFLPGFEPGSDR